VLRRIGRRKWFACIAYLGAAVCGAAEVASAPPERMEAFERAIPGLVARYQAWDASFRDGVGRSDATASGDLGWGESGFLHRYIMCWFATRDAYWLDKIIDHFDRMIADLDDPDGDGFLSWRDVKYSVALVDISADGETHGLTVATHNGDRRVYVGKAGGRFVTGHTYAIQFLSRDRLRVVDTTGQKTLATVRYKPGMLLDVIPGVKLRIRGAGRADVRFVVRTTAPQPCEYQVHDGMVTYPVALFIEQVRNTPSLPRKYRDKADEYLALLYKHFLLRWEKTWIEVPPDAGLYRFTGDPTQRFPGYSLPHNQYLALGRTWLVPADLKGFPGARLCAERARKTARYFKRNLRLTREGAYVWNYWDPLPGEDVGRHGEDRSHATIDIDFAIEAAHRGVVFNEEDLRRFARTYVDVMWNGDRVDPRFGKRVDTPKDGRPFWWRWIQLGEVDARVWSLALAMFDRAGRPTPMIPSMVRLYDKRSGIDDSVRRRCREATPIVLASVRSEGGTNPGFEIVLPGTRLPAGWELGRWKPDTTSEAGLVEDAHGGRYAAALTGKEKPVNVWALSARFRKVRPPARVRVRAWYRAQRGTHPYFSLLGYDASGKRVQYESASRLPPSEEWRQATWECGLKPDVRAFRIMLRNGAPGTVWWDDVQVDVTPLPR